MRSLLGLIGLGLWCASARGALADDKPPAEVVKQPTADAKPPADPHFLEPDDWFFIPASSGSAARGEVKLGKKTDDPVDIKGATRFAVPSVGRAYDAKVFFKTRIARPEDLFVGRWVVYPRHAIKSKADKDLATDWNYRRIVNLVDAPKGQLIVAGRTDSVVERDGLRVIVGGDADPTIVMTGKEDAHHFHAEHWLVYTDTTPPDAGGHDTTMALAIKAPDKPGAAGTFLVLVSGDIITTKVAYKTHVATKAELKAGLRVALFTNGGDAPTRAGAYYETWRVGNLTSFTNGIPKMDNASVGVETMRVVE
jgi:hypothetical protein